MNNSRWLFLTFIILFTACKNENVQPHLDINGHWLVDHGLHDDCQVSATFTEKLLVVSVYSLEDGACRPELYGIENNALAIQIDNKEDYFNDDGVLATELEVSVPSRQAFGTLVLTQTSSGLEGSIVAASDPRGLLKPLLEPTFLLSRVSEEWVPLVLGTWGPGCINVSDLEFACAMLHFNDGVSGKVSFYGRGFTGAATHNKDETSILEGDPINWTEATFALRHLTTVAEGRFELDMVVFSAALETKGGPIVLRVSEGKIEMIEKDENGESISVELLPSN